jgi:hypothetical protein
MMHPHNSKEHKVIVALLFIAAIVAFSVALFGN